MNDEINPQTDTAIPHPYSAKALEQKVKNKTALQNEFGWPEEPKRAVVCFPEGMSDEQGGKLLKEIVPGLLSLNVELLILGKGSDEYGQYFTELQKEHAHRVHIVAPKKEETQKMLAASDVALFLAEPNGAVLKECLAYGVVPVSPSKDGLDNYNAVQEKGNAFVYEGVTVWESFAAVVRAVETYKFPFDWRTIQKHCMANGAK